MQNVVNFMVPFFGRDGKPIAAGRVHFVKTECDALSFTDVQNSDYIDICTRNGTSIANPATLNDVGEFVLQPFVRNDNIDFKMIVDRPTGISADLNDPTPAWETELIMVSKHQELTITYNGIACVNSLAELRDLAPGSAQVLVLGYNNAGDFCPPRIFQWTTTLYEENYGTHVRSNINSQYRKGTWVCEPNADAIDVRWFGIDKPKSGWKYDIIDCAERVRLIISNYKNKKSTLYFPAGDYYFGSAVTFNNVIMDGASFKKTGVNDSVILTLNNVDVRSGAHFDDGIIVRKKGILYTSWLDNLNQLDATSLDLLDYIIFNKTFDYNEYSLNTPIKNKKILVKKGIKLPQYLDLSDCEIFYEDIGRLHSNTFQVGYNIWKPGIGGILYNKHLLYDVMGDQRGLLVFENIDDATDDNLAPLNPIATLNKDYFTAKQMRLLDDKGSWDVNAAGKSVLTTDEANVSGQVQASSVKTNSINHARINNGVGLMKIKCLTVPSDNLFVRLISANVYINGQEAPQELNSDIENLIDIDNKAIKLSAALLNYQGINEWNIAIDLNRFSHDASDMYYKLTNVVFPILAAEAQKTIRIRTMGRGRSVYYPKDDAIFGDIFVSIVPYKENDFLHQIKLPTDYADNSSEIGQSLLIRKDAGTDWYIDPFSI